MIVLTCNLSPEHGVRRIAIRGWWEWISNATSGRSEVEKSVSEYAARNRSWPGSAFCSVSAALNFEFIAEAITVIPVGVKCNSNGVGQRELDEMYRLFLKGCSNGILFTVVKTWIVVLWPVAPRGLACGYRRFGGQLCLLLPEWNIPRKCWQPTTGENTAQGRRKLYLYLNNTRFF